MNPSYGEETAGQGLLAVRNGLLLIIAVRTMVMEGNSPCMCYTFSGLGRMSADGLWHR